MSMSSDSSLGRKLRGNALCLEALAMLRAGDITADDLAQRCGGVDRDVCLQWLAGMVHAGLAHVVDWRVNAARKGPRVPVYRMGEGVSALPPKGTPRSRKTRLANLAALALLWRELESPCTRADLVEATGFSVGTVRRLVKRMHELRLIRVCGHLPRPERVGGVWTEQFRHGSGADADRPAPRPQIEHVRAYARRKRAEAANGAPLCRAWRTPMESAA